MLIKLLDHIKKENLLSIPQKGVVKDNADPLMFGRIKVEIDGLIDSDIPTERLPWVYPQVPAFLGGQSGVGVMAIPKVGSEVEVIFPYGSIYFAKYTGSWVTSVTRPTDFDTNYPDMYGFVDTKGNKFITDMVAGTTEYTHHSGTFFHIADNGDVTINSANKINLTATDSVTINADSVTVQTTTTVTVNASTNVSITGSSNVLVSAGTKITLSTPVVSIP